MPLPRDAHYVPGTGRSSVLTGDGRTITRQQAMNEFAQSVGAKNDYALRRASRAARNITTSPRYQRDLNRAVQQGMSPTEFKARAQMLSASPRDSQGRPTDQEALNEYLKATGKQPPEGKEGWY